MITIVNIITHFDSLPYSYSLLLYKSKTLLNNIGLCESSLSVFKSVYLL